MPERVAYVYSVKQHPGATRPAPYCTYLRHLMVDSQPVTVQVGQAAGGMQKHTGLDRVLATHASTRP